MVTLKEIAKKAGVSIGTVDRVVHNRGRVAHTTAQRVRKIIAELNYKPNILARSLSRSKIYQFGVLMPQISPDNNYWELAVQGIDKAYQEIKIHKIEIKYFFYDGYSPSSFIKNSQQALHSGLDGLLIAPIIYRTIDDDFVRKIPKTLPYVFFNSTVPGANNISYIGQDSYQSGRLAGNLMLMMVQEPGSLVILTMMHDDYHISKRQKGFEDYIRANSKEMEIRVYGARRTEDSQTIKQLLAVIFSQNKDLRGIYVTTALTYNVAEYLQNQNCRRHVKVVGHDITVKNARYLKDGLIDFLIGQRPEIQGYQGIYSLYRHVLLKENIPPVISMPLDVVTQENIDYYRNQYITMK